MKNILKFWIR